MTTFNNYSEMIKNIESLIPKGTHVFSNQSSEYGNGFGISVNFEYAQDRKQEIKEVAEKLKSVFTSVKITKSKKPEIQITYKPIIQNYRTIKIEA